MVWHERHMPRRTQLSACGEVRTVTSAVSMWNERVDASFLNPFMPWIRDAYLFGYKRMTYGRCSIGMLASGSAIILRGEHDEVCNR